MIHRWETGCGIRKYCDPAIVFTGFSNYIIFYRALFMEGLVFNRES